MQRVALVAGELSGDLLGAGLMRALARRHPGVRFEGIGGPAMAAEGLESLYPLETLSVMGLVEVLRHLPRLLAVRRDLVRRLSADPPDVFIGIDSPDFNLGLARRLRQRGVRTVHYVSPSVWAWRQGRVRGIARSVDRMLTLLPFEAEFYRAHEVPVSFVGHPAADRFPMETDTAGYRAALGVDADATVLAVLPGSRMGELERLGTLFAQAVERLRRARPGLTVLAPMATPALAARFREVLDKVGVADAVRLVEGDAATVMGAADVVLTASGTATLEAMLLKRPMVVAYRVAPATAWLVRRLGLVSTRHFSLPNLLAGEAVVPEYIQEAATPGALAAAVTGWLDDPAAAAALGERFRAFHETLCRGADERAADAVEATLT
ncbi:Lipid-A-disaccharide synthase [wastewater metagenome]|uniref:lipid-A-disaccharide synthase n=3 Tax=root TaxID=1 RepID=A0A5B8RB13_9ZZZZ|nr:lipid-A-disaccharide synthase [uncultured organism]